jgi:hypothetical protein
VPAPAQYTYAFLNTFPALLGHSPSAKQVYADLALQWRELAEQAEKRRQDLK